MPGAPCDPFGPAGPCGPVAPVSPLSPFGPGGPTIFHENPISGTLQSPMLSTTRTLPFEGCMQAHITLSAAKVCLFIPNNNKQINPLNIKTFFMVNLLPH
jgi:hypothetical protein